MTIEECKAKTCWRSMSTPFFVFKQGGPTSEYGTRNCIGKHCMAFCTYMKTIKASATIGGTTITETHGYCGALSEAPD